ncbi:MAG: hypothetical protein UZ17_ACD001002639 [Acidobacteria bacterium OLB17]|nr:MAG: hypothetical protein UZ17_ACD001002639 [Acidobacteria bacterium OLB17]MCZ2390865.1 hypothetical protein [Acidobacteriota bacterium]
MKNRYLAFIAVLIFAVPAFADIARPDRTPNPPKKEASVDSRLTIRLEADAKDAHLIIPRSDLNELVAQLGTEGVNKSVMTGGISQAQTIMGGLLISLAIVFGGVWAFRSGRLATKTGRIAASVALIFAGGAVTSFVYANIAPPIETRAIKGSIFSAAIQKYKFVSGSVKIEVSDKASTATLIVPDPAPSPSPSPAE